MYIQVDMANVLQIYNWSEESAEFVSQSYTNKVIICNTFRQSDYRRFNIIFPSFWTHVVLLSDAAEF